MCEVMEEVVIILKTMVAIIFMEEDTHRRRKQRIGQVVECFYALDHRCGASIADSLAWSNFACS